MFRRATVAALLLAVAAQLIGGVAFGTGCLEPCPDDGPRGTCPPVCLLCANCSHGGRAEIVTIDLVPVDALPQADVFTIVTPHLGSQLTTDILHVPILA